MKNNYLSNIDIDQIRRAIQVEEKYKYINIMGREVDFSKFMLKQIRLIHKLSKNPKWLSVMQAFEHYAIDNVFQRRKSINLFINHLKNDMNKKEDICDDTKIDEDIFSADVVMLKGVGPKFGYLLNKLGIFSIFDLISYYPKKYIDYSVNCSIRDLKIDKTVTIYGQISNVRTFTIKKGLTIIRVTISDKSGSLDLNFFYSKILLEIKFQCYFHVQTNLKMTKIVLCNNLVNLL